MSSCIGAIKFRDGEIRYYEYDGTVDCVTSHSYRTPQEVWDSLHNHLICECTCGHEEACSIYSPYGSGFYIEGKACKLCCSIRPGEVNEGYFDIIAPQDTDDWAKDVYKENEDGYKYLPLH